MKKYSVLVVDDEKNTSMGIKHAMNEARFAVDVADNLRDGLALFRHERHHIVITDLCLDKGDEGMQLLQTVKAEAPETVVIMITAFGDMEKAVRAMQMGAFDFVGKPFTADQIEVKVNKAAETISLVENNKLLRSELSREYEMIGKSEPMLRLQEQIALVARSDRTVLITGANGTGKELVGRQIQKHSDRANKPFVLVNCAAIPETLIEAELFGSKKGAFSSSIENKTGKFEQADGGTLFLDEIGDMSQAAQAKVLRVLETGEVSPIGSEKTMLVDVRVIAATNQDLPAMIQAGTFRQDLYYRLNVIPIHVPTLAERKEDIELLIGWFSAKIGGQIDPLKLFSPRALACLKGWEWPGNVRELRNVVERAFIMGRNQCIDADQIRSYLTCVGPSSADQELDTSKPFKAARDQFERDYINKVIEECGDNKTMAAERLGMRRSYLHHKLTELGIDGAQ